MALYEEGTPLARPIFVLNGRSTLAAVLRRSGEWVHEAPGLVRGLAELARPFKWHLAVILGFNICIARGRRSSR